MLQRRPKDILRVLRRTGWTPFTEPTCLSVCLYRECFITVIGNDSDPDSALGNM